MGRDRVPVTVLVTTVHYRPADRKPSKTVSSDILYLYSQPCHYIELLLFHQMLKRKGGFHGRH